MKVVTLILAVILVVPLSLESSQPFKTLDGKTITYNELVAHPKTVLMLWTTWCPNCIDDMKRMGKIMLEYKDVTFFLVDVGENRKKVASYAKRLRLASFVKENIIIDRRAVIADKHNVIGVPTFLFLSGGKVVSRTHYINSNTLKNAFKED